MNHHITLKLENPEDFNQLLTLIRNSGFHMINVDSDSMAVECHVDDFIRSLAERYLDAQVVYHKAPAVIIKDTVGSHSHLRKATG